MPRWKPDGFERLQAAAFALFDEQGFEGTTVAEIAGRAGLTERTFFNHFADKREVLFGLSAQFQQDLLHEIDAAAADLPPLDIVVRALQAANEAMFQGRRDGVIHRQRIIDANPDLHERELSKNAALTAAVATALQDRGIDPDTAQLTAGLGMLVQQNAILRWTQPGEQRSLRELLSDARHFMRVTVNQ